MSDNLRVCPACNGFYSEDKEVRKFLTDFARSVFDEVWHAKDKLDREILIRSLVDRVMEMEDNCDQEETN